MVAAIVAGNLKTIKLPKEMPDGVQLTKDIEFGKAGEHCLKLDLYRPAKLDKPVPGLIFIHGGAWKGGTKDMYRPYAVQYAQKGYVAASISYRLSSVAPFPAAVEDAKCAVRWMRAGADKYGVDPNHICVLGGSAGGHLAMMVAYSWPDKQLQGS
jgi:acetyl esterase/lipase